MAIGKDDVREMLRVVEDPELKRDLVTLGAVKKVAVCDGHVSVTVGLPGGSQADWGALRREIQGALAQGFATRGAALTVADVEFVDRAGKVISSGAAPAQAESNKGAASDKAGTPQANVTRESSALPRVKHVIAVGAGKGGVGKSTVSVNLAVALARAGHSVGLMDGDIYGPSVPTLMGLGTLEAVVRGNMIEPFLTHGVKTMTIGKLVEPDKPLIWRGPMAHGAFKQLIEQTSWGPLDYLIIDLPPGTGDVGLTMSQMLSLDGAVIVCTPQKVAQDDAVRAAGMFRQLGVDVLGVVENMSYFIGNDGVEYDIFGRGGAEQMAQRLGVPFLGACPIHMALRENGDAGNPSANFEGSEQLRRELEGIAQQLENQVRMASMRRAQASPTLTIS